MSGDPSEGHFPCRFDLAFSMAAGQPPRCWSRRCLQPPGRARLLPADTSIAAKSSSHLARRTSTYLFYSGGRSGQVYVAGLPSMSSRRFRCSLLIPLTGSTSSSKQMLGRFTWGATSDIPACRKAAANTMPLFVNDNANNRIACIRICATSRRSRFSGRFPIRAAITARRSLPRTAICPRCRHGSRCRCPKGAMRIPLGYKTEFNGMVSGIVRSIRRPATWRSGGKSSRICQPTAISPVFGSTLMPLTMPLNSVS